MRGWFRRFWWVLAGVAVLAGTGIAVWLANSGRHLPPSRARQYTAFNACLLTDSHGVSGPDAAPVWAGMQSASEKTSGKVSFLAVEGTDSVANAVPYVNTLVQRRCDLVLAAGTTEVAAAQDGSKQFSHVHFVLVGSGSSGGNVTFVPNHSTAQVTADVAKIVTDAAARVSVR